MRKSGLIGAGVVVLAAAGAGVWMTQRGPLARGSAQAAKAPGTAASTPLDFRANEVLSPQLARLSQTIEFSGPLVAPNTAVLRAKASGTLISLEVVEGARVRAGQLLGRIDMAELGSRIAERDAILASARATLLQAERSHASNERLAAQNFISGTALDNSRATLDTARAGLAAAQASLATTRVAQRDASLVAPIAGIVAKRHVLPGEMVAVEQPVLTLVDLAQLELAGSVGTHEVARLSSGMVVQVRVEGVAQPITGQLARIAPAAEAGTRSIGVTVTLANRDERLRAGQYALAQVELRDEQQRLVLPLAAVGAGGGQSHVWLIAQGVLVRRAITLGRRDDAGGRVEVLTGLATDARVLAARFDNLREGAPARVLAAEPLAAAGTVASSAASSAAAVLH
jgi:membrane fusion protein (multidrug efflux system)